MAKFFKEIFAPYIAPALASLIPGIGPAAAIGIGAAGGALRRSTDPGRQSFGDLFGAGARGAFTGAGIGAGASGLRGLASGQGFGQGFGSFFSGLNPFGSGTAHAAQGAGGGGQGLGSSAGMFTQPLTYATRRGGLGTTGTPPIAPEQSSQVGFNFRNLLGNPALLGAGIAGASQLIRSPRVPELPESVRNFQQQAQQGTAVGNLGQQRLTEQLNQPFEEVTDRELEAVLRPLRERHSDEQRRFTGVMKSLRPGSDELTDTRWAEGQARLNEQQNRELLDETYRYRRQVSSDFQGQRAQQILSSQGIDAQRLASLAQAGQIDLDQVFSQLNIDYADRQFLRDFLLKTGANIAVSQIPAANPYAYGFNPFATAGGR